VPVLFVILCWLMVRYLFQDMPLDATLPENVSSVKEGAA
jgi:uncharacterized membrane protein YhdT